MDLRRTLLTFRNMVVFALILIIVNGLPFHHAPLSNKYRDWINKVQRISSVEDFDIPIIHSYQLHVFCYLLKIIECEIKWFEKFMCFFRSRNIINDKQAVCIKKKKPNQKTPSIWSRNIRKSTWNQLFTIYNPLLP